MTNNLFNVPRMRRVKRVHFVGIGGVGMCGIAEVLLNEGYHVTGSDLNQSPITKRLRSLGALIFLKHASDNVEGADVVVQSSAVDEKNPEIVTAKANNIPIIPRAEMLAELMRFKYGIAIAGTHGKTTTTSLVSSVLAEAGLDPSYVIGGKLKSTGSTAKLGTSPYFVAEADESDASFLCLKPMMAVVTNIDADHMGTYNEDFQVLQQNFIDFLQHLPFYGLAIICIDDDKTEEIMSKIQRPLLTYGFSADADIRAYDWEQNGLKNKFKVDRKGYSTLVVEFNLPGRHNVQNALAAIAIATELDVDDEVIENALAQFQGVGRRFQVHGDIVFEKGQALLIDDYGHHPKEISSTIEAMRHVWPTKRFVHVFQPHRFSRTKALFEDFATALSHTDKLILLDVFSAGEPPVEGINSETLAEKIKTNTKDIDVSVMTLSALEKALDQNIMDGDILLMQGAGSIGRFVQTILKEKAG
jgi:UDP-N-acetylmuramate--alanine ligase